MVTEEADIHLSKMDITAEFSIALLQSCETRVL